MLKRCLLQMLIKHWLANNMNEINSTDTMRMVRYYLPAMGWIILILFLCTMPASDLPSASWMDKLYIDKLVHCFLFGGTVLLLAYGYYKQRNHISGWMLFGLALTASLYGIAIEFIQKYFTANRHFEVWDIIADSIGAFGGALIFWLIGKRFLKKG